LDPVLDVKSGGPPKRGRGRETIRGSGVHGQGGLVPLSRDEFWIPEDEDQTEAGQEARDVRGEGDAPTETPMSARVTIGKISVGLSSWSGNTARP